MKLTKEQRKQAALTALEDLYSHPEYWTVGVAYDHDTCERCIIGHLVGPENIMHGRLAQKYYGRLAQKYYTARHSIAVRTLRTYAFTPTEIESLYVQNDRHADVHFRYRCLKRAIQDW